MPAAIWAAPMARVRVGRLERPCIRSRQGLGPRFQTFASATGWMRAMTPSPMRTMAAKCFARVGVVMSMVVGGVAGGVVLSVGSVAGQAKNGGPSPSLRSRVRMTAKDKQRQGQQQRKKQIPGGNDRKKSKRKGTHVNA